MEEESKKEIEEQKNNQVVEEEKEQEKKTTETETKEKKEEPEEKKSLAREILEWVICIVIAFSLAVVIKYFIFTPTLVKQSSMYPTIYSGDRVFVNRLVRTFRIPLEKGDIITLEAPARITSGDVVAYYDEYTGMKYFAHEVLEFGRVSYIKRVIGVAGDTIKFEDGKVFVNGEELDESKYLPDGTYTSIELAYTSKHVPSEFVVPEGYVFAMGDNRNASQDCRQLGCIPIEKIEGKVLFRLWPLNRFGGIEKSNLTSKEVDAYNSRSRRGSI